MVSCKYCGSYLKFIGQDDKDVYFFCDFCEMSFLKDEVCEDRKRKSSVPSYYDDNYYKSTKELLKHNTIELFHMLRDCRSQWYEVFRILKMMVDQELSKNEKETYDQLYKEYIKLTKQKFVIENIILEKAGFLPDKITDEFLSDLVTMGKNSSSKPMYIYINNQKGRAC